jgi:ribosomal protein S18 acetylase RimI-like enzyme
MVSIQETIAEAATVRRATGEDVAGMAGALARAFHDDPVFSWVLRGDPRRMTRLERGFELFMRRVWMDQEETYTTASVAGVAVWEKPGQWKTGVGRQLALLPSMLRVFGRHLPRVLRAIAALEARHPRELHYYLPFVGVDPEWQGRGLGSAVLAPVLERCDREGMPAFLESSTPRNRALYERHGFTVSEEFKLGRTAPLQWRMWREPGGGTSPPGSPAERA